MSFDTFDNLKAEIIDWSHRDDLDENINSFIALAETAMLANPDENLKIRSQEVRAAFSTSITDRFAALPTGYLSSRKIRIQIVNGESIPLTYRAPEQLNILSSAGMPLLFTITDQIEFDRISDQVYAGEIQYYQAFTPLSDANTTNDVLTSFPTIYQFGALWALKTFTNEEQAAAEYYAKFIGAIKGANDKIAEGRYGPSPAMHVEGPTP